MQDKVMTCIEQFSQHMCLVHFTRAYITHVCKDCITASQGSLWINQQHVASQGPHWYDRPAAAAEEELQQQEM